ncbi:hypothetical protein B0H13DRAFT_1860858 [Mycena leptocephala]|nr:hypothetical protein B0H13DRAFT_1860858 [Mycena leptocephala]
MVVDRSSGTTIVGTASEWWTSECRGLLIIFIPAILRFLGSGFVEFLLISCQSFASAILSYPILGFGFTCITVSSKRMMRRELRYTPKKKKKTACVDEIPHIRLQREPTRPRMPAINTRVRAHVNFVDGMIPLSPTRNTPLSPWPITSPSSQSAPPTAAPIMQDLPVPELPFHARATVTFTLHAYIPPSAFLHLSLPSNTTSARLANSTPSSMLDQATGGCCYALVARMIVQIATAYNLWQLFSGFGDGLYGGGVQQDSRAQQEVL